MTFTCAQISLIAYFDAPTEEIKAKLEEAMNIACSYLEEQLKHENISYNFTQFKTEEES